MTLDLILDALHQFGQRATYGAVGGLLNRPALGVMQGRPKDCRHSWVVPKGNGQPTGYQTGEVDPRLQTSPSPIDTAEALRAWLQATAEQPPRPGA